MNCSCLPSNLRGTHNCGTIIIRSSVVITMTTTKVLVATAPSSPPSQLVTRRVHHLPLFSLWLLLLVSRFYPIESIAPRAQVTSLPFLHPISIGQYYTLASNSNSSVTASPSFSSSSSSPSSTTAKNKTKTTPALQPHVIFVPGFQGTLLYHCNRRPRTCQPLFLSPLTPTTSLQTYQQLQSVTSSSISVMHDAPNSVDYASFTCARRPFSHTAHCNAVPAAGPVQALINNLTASVPSLIVHTVPYDWRQSMDTLLHSSSTNSFATTMARIMARIMALASHTTRSAASYPVVVVAHGTGCHLVSHFFSKRNRAQETMHQWRQRIGVGPIVCVAPTHPAQAVTALRNGTGMLTTGAAHAHIDACANVHDPHRVDFSHVDSYLGLNRRRLSLLSVPAGAWDSPSPTARFATTLDQRKSLARAFPAVVELAASEGTMPSIDSASRVVCIEARRSQSNENIHACQLLSTPTSPSGHQSGTHSPHFLTMSRDVCEHDLVELASDVVLRLLVD